MTRATLLWRSAAKHPVRSGRRRPLIVLLACFAFADPSTSVEAAMLKTGQVNAGQVNAAQVNAAEFSGKQPPVHAISPLSVRLQVLLARAHFSPGEIDGKFGQNAKKALRGYAEAQRLAGGDQLTPQVWQKLAADNAPVLATYQITDKDLAGPFLAKLPHKMEAMKRLSHLGYTSPREALAERFHMSEELLTTLNPGQHFRKAGETIVVTNLGTPTTVAQAGATVKAAHVEIDKTAQTVRAFDASGRLLDFYPATVGSAEKPSPSGTLKVTAIQRNPTYHYNPAYRFKGVHAKKRFVIKPGPNNPVGTVWISLSAEGYGIHGTPDPGKVSKAASHGCVRLTNWDAQALATEVSKGTPVSFVDKSG